MYSQDSELSSVELGSRDQQVRRRGVPIFHVPARAYPAMIAGKGSAATVARRPRVTSISPSFLSSAIARWVVPTATV